ncbi:Glycinol 4-dimethylallyltransferase [Spatholobus suberectus]|nr:Glycinol 4-dimethylallyltransferase [Spatholobus suberectus]
MGCHSNTMLCLKEDSPEDAGRLLLITITITTLSAFSSSFLAVEKLSDISPSFFIGVLQAVVLHVFIGVYISAVNQFFDLEIDKINKPYLPLASGQFSVTTGVIISASFLTLGFWLSWIIGSWPLFWSLVLISSLWTAYSINIQVCKGYEGESWCNSLSCCHVTWGLWVQVVLISLLIIDP